MPLCVAFHFVSWASLALYVGQGVFDASKITDGDDDDEEGTVSSGAKSV